MSYNTDYTLSFDHQIPEQDDILDYLETHEVQSYCCIMDFLEEPCPWYDHEEHMKNLSERFPNVLFTLGGVGEKRGDIWRKYFKGGKVQTVRAEISYEPFDEAKLR